MINRGEEMKNKIITNISVDGHDRKIIINLSDVRSSVKNEMNSVASPIDKGDDDDVFTFLVGQCFQSYLSLEDAIKRFENENFCQLYKGTSRTLTAAAGRCPNRIEGANQSLLYFHLKYLCIFGGRKPKLRDDRKRSTRTFRQGCPFHIRLELSQDKQALEVIEFNMKHNHVLSSNVYNQLPRQRIIKGEYKEEIKKIMQSNPNNKLIQRKIQRETGCAMTLSDIRRLKYKTKKSNENKMESVISLLRQDKESLVEVAADEQENFTCLFYQDKRMKHSYNLFPELLIVDATYKLLDLKIPVYLLFIVNGNGLSEIVGVFTLAQETEVAMKIAVNFLKDSNSACERTQVIIGGFEERDVFSKCFPCAAMQMCLHHVLCKFRGEVTMERMGVTSEERIRCLDLFANITKSRSSAEYELHVNELKSTGIKSVISYFEKNWAEIKEEWVTGLKDNKFNLGGSSNNLLESLNSKIKENCTRTASIKQFFAEFIFLMDVLRNESEGKQLISSVNNIAAETEIIKYIDYITPYAFNKISLQNNQSKHVKINNIHSEREYVIYSKDMRSIITSSQNCSCNFMKQFGLPCCHVFKVRCVQGMAKFDMGLVAYRWTLQYLREEIDLPDCSGDSNVVVDSPNKPKPLTETEKYTKALHLAQNVASVICEGGMEEFSTKISQMENLLEFWKPSSDKTSQPSYSSIPSSSLSSLPFPSSSSLSSPPFPSSSSLFQS